MRRHVLIVENEPLVANSLCSLLTKLGCEGDIARGGDQALTMMRRKSFDAVLLDLRCVAPPPTEWISGINKIRPSLIGRVLVITGEVADPEIIKILDRRGIFHVSRTNLMQELWGRLRTIFDLSA